MIFSVLKLFFLVSLVVVSAFISEVNNGFLKETERLLLRIRRNSEIIEPNYDMVDHAVPCCNFITRNYSEIEDDSDNMMKYFHECKITTNLKIEKFPREKARNSGTCILDCLFGKYGATDKDGYIISGVKSVNIIVGVIQYASSNQLKEISDKCVKISREMTDNEEGSFACKRGSMNYVLCAYDMNNLDCPEYIRVNNDMCKAHRKKLQIAFTKSENQFT